MAMISKASVVEKSEQGLIVFSTLTMAVVGGFLVFSFVYNVFFRLRDHTEQDQLAQSAAVVALKAYVRAGSESNLISQRQQITYALDAAARVLSIDDGLSDNLSQIAVPFISRAEFEASTDSMPSSPITVTLRASNKDSSDDFITPSAEITLGRVSRTEAPYILEAFKGVPALDVIIGARVFVKGITRPNRASFFPGYFKSIWLSRSESQVLVLCDLRKARSHIADAITIIHEKVVSSTPSDKHI